MSANPTTSSPSDTVNAADSSVDGSINSASRIQSVSFIGLGAMGWRMAAHLPRFFAEVRVWNRTEAKAAAHAAQFGTRAVELAAAVQADVIFSCLPTSAEVRDLIDRHPPRAGSIWVDCTSGDPASARELAAHLSAQGVHFLDAPVSGQTSGAEAGTLTVMVGGDPAALEQARSAIAPFAELIVHVGQSGSGFAVKAVNNLLLAINLWGAGEGLSILKANGVSLPEALQCINASSGRSLASENIIPQRVLNRAFPCTFALDLLAKDTGIALDLALQQRIAAPVSAQIQSLIRAASQLQTQPADFSEAIKLLEQMTGIEIS